MRIAYLVVLLVLFGAVGILALENRAAVTVHYFGQSSTCPHSLLVAVVYLLGMISGWFMIGFARRLIRESV